MHTSTVRLVAAHAICLLCALIATGCGGDDQDSDSSAAEKSDAKSAATEPAPGDAGSRTGGGTFTISAKLATCIETAGYSQDAPPTSALAAWRHPSGRRAVVLADPAQSQSVATEISSSEYPANIVGTDVVTTGTGAPTKAIAACLQNRS